MGGIALAFIVSMGLWIPRDDNDDNTIARVDQEQITIEEYRRAYKNASSFYRDLLQEKYDDKAFRKLVIEELVERRLWAQEALAMKLVVTDMELRDAVIHLPGFQKEGTFNPQLYKRVLANEKLTPTLFEQRHRTELLIEKAKNIVKGATALTPVEKAEVEKEHPTETEKSMADHLLQKQQRSLQAYTLAIKARAVITIHEDLL